MPAPSCGMPTRRTLLRDRCIEHYRTTCLRLAEQARYRLVEWLAWMDLEIDNIRAVLFDCVASGDLARGLDIATSMRYYWITHGTTESTRWFDQLLASGEGSPTTLVRAYYLRGWLGLLKGDPETAKPWIVRAITTARESGAACPLVGVTVAGRDDRKRGRRRRTPRNASR